MAESIASIHKYAVDLTGDTLRVTLRTPLAMHNALAQTFALEVTKERKYHTLTGAGCVGYFIRADGTTVLIDGTVSGNIALVTLPAACYAVQGRCKLSVTLTMGSAIHTLLQVEGYVDTTRTDAAVDPGSVIPSIDDLLAQIAAMKTATTAANEAAAEAGKKATLADTAATAANDAKEKCDKAVDAIPGQIEKGMSDFGLVVENGKLCVRVERK